MPDPFAALQLADVQETVPRRGGGGPARRFVHEFRENFLLADGLGVDFTAAMAAYNELEDDDPLKIELVAKGRRATVAHQEKSTKIAEGSDRCQMLSVSSSSTRNTVVTRKLQVNGC